MGQIPTGRATTYFASSPGNPCPVRSADLNAIQDALAQVRPHFFDDFYGGDTGDISGTNWLVNADGTGGADAPETINRGHYVSVRTGTSNTDKTTIDTRSTQARLVDLPAFRARVRFSHTTSSEVFIGLHDAANSYAPDLSFTRNTQAMTNPTHLKLNYRDGAGLQLIGTGIAPAAGTWYVLEVVVVSVDEVYWAVKDAENNTPLAEGTIDTSGDAIDGTAPLHFRASCETSTAAARTLDVDYVSCLGGRPA